MRAGDAASPALFLFSGNPVAYFDISITPQPAMVAVLWLSWGSGMRRAGVATVTTICGLVLLGAGALALLQAEPADAQLSPVPSSSSSSLAAQQPPSAQSDAGAAPTAAPRPAQIEPMVAPVKRQAPPTPVLTKPKTAGKAVDKKAGVAKAARKPPARTAEKSDTSTGSKKKR